MFLQIILNSTVCVSVSVFRVIQDSDSDGVPDLVSGSSDSEVSDNEQPDKVHVHEVRKTTPLNQM